VDDETVFGHVTGMVVCPECGADVDVELNKRTRCQCGAHFLMRYTHSNHSARSEKVMKYLRDYTTAHGYPPTLREIMVEVGLSTTSAVSYHLRQLENIGRIKRSPRASRAIRILEARSDT
jgi:uncharacterized Zn finger protein (UPF0148 family)